MDQNEFLTKKWFEDNHQTYQVDIVDAQAGLYKGVGPVLSRQVRGRSLVVGSGPLLNFSLPKEGGPAAVCLDLAVAPLQRLGKMHGPEKILPLCADAARLPLADATFDSVVLPFILHHTAQDTAIKTAEKVAQILGEAARVAGPGHRVIVLDLFLNGAFQTLQKTFYNSTRKTLNRMKKPMMFFQSSQNLSHPRLKKLSDERIPLPEKIVPTLLLPKFQFPGKYHPAEIHLLTFQVA